MSGYVPKPCPSCKRQVFYDEKVSDFIIHPARTTCAFIQLRMVPENWDKMPRYSEADLEAARIAGGSAVKLAVLGLERQSHSSPHGDVMVLQDCVHIWQIRENVVPAVVCKEEKA